MPSASPARIELLPEHLIDQIKAGEVVERPSNLIKEILENSLDAKASRIELIIKNNGLDLIQLKDNGHGIFSQDLALAFSRHATSKISRFDDLYRLNSFGFRGEALASIAAIAKVHCLSFNQSENFGSEILLEAGVISHQGKIQKTSQETGTILNIQNLFYNTPVRLKFIQSQQTEKNYLKKIIYSFILSHPQVEFILQLDDEEKLIFPAVSKTEERLLEIVPKAKNQILSITKTYDEKKFTIHLIPSHLRAPIRLQYLFINQRMITDKQLLKIISQALAANFGNDDFHFLGSLEIPGGEVDVNIHPSKTVVKIFEASKIIGLITACIKEIEHGTANSSQSIKSPGLNYQTEAFEWKKEMPHIGPQKYNLEGQFSPHMLNQTASVENLFWVGHFIARPAGISWDAIHAGKLLQKYVENKMISPNISSIPLLVSVPFDVPKDLKRLELLNNSGFELEKLSPQQVVLRTIPDWMSGFPLKALLDSLIQDRPIHHIQINPSEWPKSAWEKMIQEIGHEEMRRAGISFDLLKKLEN